MLMLPLSLSAIPWSGRALQNRMQYKIKGINQAKIWNDNLLHYTSLSTSRCDAFLGFFWGENSIEKI